MPIDQLIRDVRVGARGLVRDWGFTFTATVSLALGIAAATAMYSVIHAVIIDPFPYKDVDSLTSIRVYEPGQQYGRTGYTIDQFLELRERATIFEGVIVSTWSDVTWTGDGDPQRIRGNYGPFDTFDVMGVPPLIGRTPSVSDAAADAQPVVVLGYRFWQRQFGGDSSVLGRYLTLNGVTRQVIGVMPKRFMWRGADVYLPTQFQRGVEVAGIRNVHVLARLKPGVTEAQAEADLRPIVEHMQQIAPRDFPEKWRVGLLSFKETFPSGMQQALWILFGATGLLLLISCANVSNLLLSRAAGRQREMAVRASLGAGRWRLVRQLLTESVVLATAAGATGIVLAYALLRAMISIVPPDTIPDEAEIVMNVPVMLFCAGISVVTALLFGLAPALHGCTPNLVEPLKSGARTSSGTRGWSWVRSGLVVVEVALSLMLLTGAAQMMRTLVRLQSLDLGFQPERILSMRVPLSNTRYPDPERRVTFYRDLLERLHNVPGVTAASASSGLHPFFGWSVRIVLPNGQEITQPTGFHLIDPGYFNVYGFQFLSGRTINAPDVSGKRQIAVVNETFVKRYFPNSAALGSTVRIPMLSRAPLNLTDPGFEIVGVVRDVINTDPKEGIRPEMFIPYSIMGDANYITVRTAIDPSSVMKAVAAQVYSIDREQPVAEMRTLDDAMKTWVLSRPRFNLILFGVFASLGLILATIGVYGVISKVVAQRTPEIGLRMALGASFADIAGMVLRNGLTLVFIGLGIGLAATVGVTRLLASKMREFAGFDIPSFIAVCVVLLIAGGFACFWPARRAARIDPAIALRNE